MTGNKITDDAKSLLLGRKIVDVRPLTEKEIDAEGWYHNTNCLVLDDGMIIIPSCDDEGNNSGVLFGRKKKETYRFGYHIRRC
jgi:hypothetical protein